jgi:PIN domain nuclease of toxin-antitoxin system
MDYLLDTHTVIWFFNGDDKLSENAKQLILKPEDRMFISIASVWEVAIKISLKKLAFPGNTKGFLDLIDDNGFELLPLDRKYILELEKLDFFHRDPFDRILVATAISEKMCIITTDTNIRLYPVNCSW